MMVMDKVVDISTRREMKEMGFDFASLEINDFNMARGDRSRDLYLVPGHTRFYWTEEDARSHMSDKDMLYKVNIERLE